MIDGDTTIFNSWRVGAECLTAPSVGFFCSAWENRVGVGEMLPWGSLACLGDFILPVTPKGRVWGSAAPAPQSQGYSYALSHHILLWGRREREMS